MSQDVKSWDLLSKRLDGLDQEFGAKMRVLEAKQRALFTAVHARVDQEAIDVLKKKLAIIK